MKKKAQKLLVICLGSVLVLLVIIIVVFTQRNRRRLQNGSSSESENATTTVAETFTEAETEDPFLTGSSISVDLLPINEYSRPGTKLTQVNAIVVHYVGNPGTTAAQNRSYFANLAESGETYASSNYIIGLQGEIILCVPIDEVAYASNDRNWDTLSIECCHPTEDGHFNYATYSSLVTLCAALCKTYGLNPETDVIRHYDITGKECPYYYVKNPDEWATLQLEIKGAMLGR